MRTPHSPSLREVGGTPTHRVAGAGLRAGATARPRPRPRPEACGSESGETSKRITILDCGELAVGVRQAKRLKTAEEVARCLQFLRKHRECKKARKVQMEW